MRVMRGVATVGLGLALAWGVGACGEKEGAPPGAGEGAGEAPAASGLVLADRTLDYEVRRDADQRALVMSTRVAVPQGWEPDPSANPGPTMTTLLSGGGAGANPFTLSNVTISATCHGQCRPDKLEEQTVSAGAQQLPYAGSEAKLIKDEQIRPGVWGFVIEVDKGEDGKAYTLGVTHWGGPDWPQVIFCNAHLQREHAAAWPQIYEACASAVVTLQDPLMPAEVLASERARLAECPDKTAITYRADPERDGEPVELGDVVSVYANAGRPGLVDVYLANFELETTHLSRSPLEGDRRVLKLSFEHREQGEVLGGSYGTLFDGDTLVRLGLHVAGGRTLNWDPHRTEGAVEIIARTPDKICGRVAIRGGNRGDITGVFVADLTIGRAK